ncbi:MAG: CCA tRNA nucleotidyltransferase [Candidatus Brocadiia bacterium]
MDNLYKIALEVVKTLQSKGYQAYFAGGCVRDRLMKRIPQDYDVATNARPNEVIKLFPKTLSIGKAFGVIIVLVPIQRKPGKSVESVAIEVTTFRAEGPYSDGRRPDSVKFTQRDDDVARRDFTINGLLYDPIKKELVDLVKGKNDIRAKVIKTIGDPAKRFNEDRLRMLRAIRFACQLGFKIDPKTKSAIKRLARRIKGISAERIREELKKILISPRSAEGIEMLRETGLLKEILPEIVKMRGVKQPVQFHPEGDVYVHTLKVLKHLRKPSFDLALTALLHDIGKPGTFMITDRIRFHEHERVGAEMAERICKRLKLSNAQIETITWIISKHLVFKDIDKMRVSTLKKLFVHPAYPELNELHRADRLACDMDLKPYHKAVRLYKKYSKKELKPTPLLNGYDLIKLKLKPGPIFSELLHKLEEAQLENSVKTKSEAIALIKKILADKPK